jgi:flavorubredoxin
MLKMLEVREVKNRLFGYFGSFTWAGAAIKRLTAFNEKMKWEVVGDPVEMKQSMNVETSAKCIHLGQAMARQLKIEN